MSIGVSIFLIAVGAILYFAVTASLAGIDIPTVGLILMIVGILGLIISFLYVRLWAPRQSSRAHQEVVRERERY
jgi:positive regulator of sigma E activity